MPMRAAYFLAQGVATLAWWVVIGLSPSARSWFAFGDDGRSLLTFLVADVFFWIGGSLAAAWGEWSGAAWTAALRPVLCGALACSVIHALTLALLTRAGWPGVLLMLSALLSTAWLTWHAPAFHT